MYKLTEKGKTAVREILDALSEVVGARPEGYPAGELYAALMPLTPTLSAFETLMKMAEREGKVEKRGQLYFRKDPRDPDYSRPGIFATHNCWRCKDGSEPARCPTPDRPGNCGYPHARND